MSLSPIDAIKDPIYGYIEINPIERSIIDHPIFQRLRYVYQLQIAYFTYPSAVHTRFAHSLGVMDVAGFFSEHLLNTYIYNGSNSKDLLRLLKTLNIFYRDINDAVTILKQSIKLAALIHDIGHGPFSHAFDDTVFESILITRDKNGNVIVTTEQKHKKMRSTNNAPRIALNHEIWGFIITFVSDLFDALDERIRDLTLLLFAPIFSNDSEAKLFVEFLRHFAEGWRKKWLEKYGQYLVIGNFRLHLPLLYTLRHVYRSFPWCADIIDFTLRDSYFSGTIEYGYVDWQRLIKYSRLEGHSTPQHQRFYITIDSRARDAILNFLLARYFMYSAVYFHRTTRRHEHILKKLIKTIEETFGIKETIIRALSGNRDTLLSFIYGLWITVYTDVSFLSYSEFLAWNKIKQASIENDKETLRAMIKILFYTFTLRQRTRIYNFLKETDLYYQGDQKESNNKESNNNKAVGFTFEIYYGSELNIKLAVPKYTRYRSLFFEKLSNKLVELLKKQVELKSLNQMNIPRIITAFMNYIKYKSKYFLGGNDNKFIKFVTNIVLEILNKELEPVMVDIVRIDILPSGLIDNKTIYMYDPATGDPKQIQEKELEELVPIQLRKIRIRIYVLTHILEEHGEKIHEFKQTILNVIQNALQSDLIRTVLNDIRRNMNEDIGLETTEPTS